MKTFILAILAFFALPVFAVGIGNDNPPGGGGGTQIQAQSTNVSNRITSESRANAAAFAGSAAYSGGNSVTVNPANVSVTTNEAAIPTNTRVEQAGKVEVKNVPSVFAGNVYPTAPCMGSSTVGAAALGWGASVGTSWADDECGIRETARSFQNLGLMRDAVDILCSSKYAAVAPVCIASKPPKAE